MLFQPFCCGQCESTPLNSCCVSWRGGGAGMEPHALATCFILPFCTSSSLNLHMFWCLWFLNERDSVFLSFLCVYTSEKFSALSQIYRNVFELLEFKPPKRAQPCSDTGIAAGIRVPFISLQRSSCFPASSTSFSRVFFPTFLAPFWLLRDVGIKFQGRSLSTKPQLLLTRCCCLASGS